MLRNLCIQMGVDLYKELFTAVHQGDIQKVKSLFSILPGVDVRTRKVWVEWPFLHCARTADMTKLILSQGADIDAKDINGLTPLHSAVTSLKGVPVIRELLNHGANVNATDYEGNTPLTLAIIYEYLEAIQELLENGADVNIKSTSSFLGYSTPLCIAVRDYKDCAKIIIKTVLKKYYKDFRKIINLDPYISFTNHRDLSDYLQKCVSEIDLMGINKVTKYLTIFELAIENGGVIQPLYMSYDVMEKEILCNYPIYHDVILPHIRLCIIRAKLFDKLKNLQIHLLFNTVDKVIILNPDCVYKIAKYLPNDDLSNFMLSV